MVIKILIADDHAIVRDGLRLALESQTDMTVAGEARDGREALHLAGLLLPDIVVMDLSMPDMNGIEATGILRERYPKIKVVMLSMHHTSEHVFRAMQAGAWSYLLKENAAAEVIKAIRTVMNGRTYRGEGLEEPPAPGVCSAKSPIDSLSRREREVFQLVAEGKTSSYIGKILSLSPKSVETYRSRLMLKLGVDCIPSLVKFALLHGITGV